LRPRGATRSGIGSCQHVLMSLGGLREICRNTKMQTAGGLRGIKSARSCERKCPDALLYRKSLSRIAGATLTTGVAHCQDKMNMFTYWIEINPVATLKDKEWLTKPPGRVISKTLLLNREGIRACARFVDLVVAVFEHQRDSRALPDVLPSFQNSGGHAARQVNEACRIGRDYDVPLDRIAGKFPIRGDGSVRRIVCCLGLPEGGVELRMQDDAMKARALARFVDAGRVTV